MMISFRPKMDIEQPFFEHDRDVQYIEKVAM